MMRKPGGASTRSRVLGTLPMGCWGIMSNRTVLMPGTVPYTTESTLETHRHPHLKIYKALKTIYIILYQLIIVVILDV